jgi:uroporphyrinogen decarboxylase
MLTLRTSPRRAPDIRRLTTTLRNGKADWVPNVELGISPVIKAKLIGRTLTGLADDVEFWHRAEYDYIKLQPAVDFDPGKAASARNVRVMEEGVERKWASESTGVIGTQADLDRYRFPTKEDFDYSKFDQVGPLLPQGMGVVGQYGDIFTMTWEMMGFEHFSVQIYENPELVEGLNQRLGELVVSMFRRMAESKIVDALWYSDDIAYDSGLMVSPKTLHKYFFPWLQEIGNIARASGKPFIYHSDGVLYDMLPEIIRCGVDALHPIEPKSMKLAEIKGRFGDRISLIGHVDVDLLSRGTPEEVREIVRQNIDVAARNGGYCAGSGNSIPEYVRVENYLAMLDAAYEFGRS